MPFRSAPGKVYEHEKPMGAMICPLNSAFMGIVTWLFNGWGLCRGVYDLCWVGIVRSTAQRLSGAQHIGNLVAALWAIIA